MNLQWKVPSFTLEINLGYLEWRWVKISRPMKGWLGELSSTTFKMQRGFDSRGEGRDQRAH